jgi:transcription initiation factor TFIID TATA-box-binding protein
MEGITIENIVASAKLAEELDIKKLADSIADSKYNPEEFPGLVLHFDNPKTALLLFKSGKVICTGAKNIDDVKTAIGMLHDKIKEIGISVFEKPEVNMQNIVASSDLEKEFHLGSIAKRLLAENVEYKPEQFPGLVYRVKDLGVVLLLFSSGKIVCTGAKNFGDISIVIDTLKEKLSSLGVL